MKLQLGRRKLFETIFSIVVIFIVVLLLLLCFVVKLMPYYFCCLVFISVVVALYLPSTTTFRNILRKFCVDKAIVLHLTENLLRLPSDTPARPLDPWSDPNYMEKFKQAVEDLLRGTTKEFIDNGASFIYFGENNWENQLLDKLNFVAQKPDCGPDFEEPERPPRFPFQPEPPPPVPRRPEDEPRTRSSPDRTDPHPENRNSKSSPMIILASVIIIITKIPCIGLCIWYYNNSYRFNRQQMPVFVPQQPVLPYQSTVVPCAPQMARDREKDVCASLVSNKKPY